MGQITDTKGRFVKGHTPWWVRQGVENPCKFIKYTKSRNKKISEKMKGQLNHRFGKKPINYIDGRSSMGSYKYGCDWKKIRILILRRDNHQCQMCGIEDVKLDIHHIVPFMDSFDNSLNNLITLCRQCHAKAEGEVIRSDRYTEAT